MYFKNHLIFSVFFVIFFINLFSLKLDYLYVIIFSLFTCLLPDIDHPRSFLGYKFKWLFSWLYCLKHRSITHSFIFVLFLMFLICNINLLIFHFNKNIITGLILGYVSHILADMFTCRGVDLFWPYKRKIRFPFYFFLKNKQIEYYFCMFLLFISLFLFFFNKKNI